MVTILINIILYTIIKYVLLLMYLLIYLNECTSLYSGGWWQLIIYFDYNIIHFFSFMVKNQLLSYYLTIK